jgi:hypothetical protein
MKLKSQSTEIMSLRELVAEVAALKTHKSNVLGFSTTRVLCVVVFIVCTFCLVIFGFHPEHSKAYAQRRACANNLRAIDAVKHQWAIDFKKQAGDPIAAGELEDLFVKHYRVKPRCPADGTYSYGETVGAAPICSFPGHTLLK